MDGGGAQPSVEQFVQGLGVTSPQQFVENVQAMQAQQIQLAAATEELRGALAHSQAVAADAVGWQGNAGGR